MSLPMPQPKPLRRSARMARKAVKAFVATACVASGPRPVLGDLPAHCLLQDIAGEWEFHVGPAVTPHALGSAQPPRLPACGHHIPNNVLSMLAIDRSAQVPPSSERIMRVNMTETIVEHPRRRLRATSSDGSEGFWTMVFDEGFEMRLLSGESFFAHSFFELVGSATDKPSNGDRWTKIAEYFGRKSDEIRLAPKGELYACHCDQTAVGWWHKHVNGRLESGCWWGHKAGAAEAMPTSLVSLRGADAQARPPVVTLAGAGAVASSAFDAESDRTWELALDGRMEKEVIAYKAASHAQPKSVTAEKSTQLASIGRLRGSATPATELPKSWDWREQMKDMWHDGRDGLSEQFDQGNCGSCYAFSGALVLQMRFRIQLLKQHGLYYPLELSWKSATRCSPYTEGCEGGFAYLIFKMAAEVGLPLADCDRTYEAKDLDNACDWSCYGNDTMVFHAKDYGQVGGFAYGASEEAIMQEIYENGPVIVSFATTATPEFIYNNGRSWLNDTSVITSFKNERVPRERASQNPDIKSWRHTTHSILAVGWGEEVTVGSSEPIRYWIVRNSWGTDWGRGGYAKMRRGRNDAALETSAPWVAPDMDRLPKGFLEMAKKRHEAELAAKKVPQAQGGSQRTPAAGRKKKPTYCELRPDSPDCH